MKHFDYKKKKRLKITFAGDFTETVMLPRFAWFSEVSVAGKNQDQMQLGEERISVS